MFICLSDNDAITAPLAREKIRLQEANLGEKMLTFPLCGTESDIYEEIIRAYPPLEDTGYEILKLGGQGRRDFDDISSSASSVITLKANVGQAKCYLRPIVAAIDVDEETKKYAKKDKVSLVVLQLIFNRELLIDYPSMQNMQGVCPHGADAKPCTRMQKVVLFTPLKQFYS